MKCERIPLGAQGAYLDTYFLADSPELKAGACRPAVVVCPGGGYAYTSDREAEPIALALCARGFHACVLRYPCAPARFPAALRALAEAVAWVRAGAAENHVDPRQISVCGFSAGGHLAGSLGVFWNAPFLAAETGLAPQDMRPDKMVLCYPVITGGEFAHKGSFDNLLGADADAARRAEVSLEQHVTQDTPPAFLWHTYTDPGVPVENTMLFDLEKDPEELENVAEDPAYGESLAGLQRRLADFVLFHSTGKVYRNRQEPQLRKQEELDAQAERMKEFIRERW